jgi:CRP-like cAMP-binding protein
MTVDLRRLKDEAAQAVEKGKWRKAAELYDQLAAAVPEDPSFLHRGGEAYRRLGRQSDAIARLARGAALYAQKGFLLKAIAACKIVLEIEPQHTDTQRQLAALCAEQRRQSRPVLGAGARGAQALAPGQPLASLPLGKVLPDTRELEPHVVELAAAEPPDWEPMPLSGTQVLPKTPLFSALGEPELRRLIERSRLVRVTPGELVFAQGDPGDALYVVAQGEVAVSYATGSGPDIELARLGDGAFFGEIALLCDHPRSATVRAVRPAELIAIGRDVVAELTALSPEALSLMVRFVRDRLLDTLLTTSPLFAQFSPADRQSLAARFRFLEIESGHTMVVQDERSPGLYVIAAGRCAVSRSGEPVAALGPGDLFGEASLLSHQPASASVRTQGKCYLLELARAAFAEVIVTHPPVLEYAHAVAESRQLVRFV